MANQKQASTTTQNPPSQPLHYKYDNGPNSIQGSVRNYDDDFLKAHATKPDDVIFEELLYYVNYKKQRGDYISYDEKLQIDRYCNLLLKQLRINRAWRAKNGNDNFGGYSNIPIDFYEAFEAQTLPMVTVYHKEPALGTYTPVSIAIPEEQIEVFQSLKMLDPDAEMHKQARPGQDILYTIDISAATNAQDAQSSNDPYAGMSRKEAKKAKKQATQSSSSTAATPPPNIPGRPSVPGAQAQARPNVPNVPNRPNVPNNPNKPSVPGATASIPNNSKNAYGI